ncbi:MAG: outer membrane beta-barrel protein [Acidobacteriota bacterium]
MRQRLVLCLMAVAVVSWPVAAGAQHRQPKVGAIAVGGDGGAYAPGGDLHAGARVDGFVEFYVLPRISIRGMGGWMENRLVVGDESVSQRRLSVNVIYNWEAESWHPFVTAGVGGQFFRYTQGRDPAGAMTTKPAFNVGAGVEYFSRPTLTLKFEGTYYRVRSTEAHRNPSGLAVTAGIKKYF